MFITTRPITRHVQRCNPCNKFAMMAAETITDTLTTATVKTIAIGVNSALMG